jgi:hypothetical protein
VVGQFDPVRRSALDRAVPLRDRLAEIDRNLLRAGFVNPYRESRARLHAGHMDVLNLPVNCQVVGLAARDFHPQSDPEEDGVLAAAPCSTDRIRALPVSARPRIVGFLKPLCLMTAITITAIMATIAIGRSQ